MKPYCPGNLPKPQASLGPFVVPSLSSAVVGDFEVVRAEEVDGLPLCVVVELVDEEDVGVDSLDGLRDVRRLLVASGGEVGEEFAVRVAVETGVEGGDRQRLGRRRLSGVSEGGAR